MYEAGRGLPKDDREAFIWYRKAAEGGDATGQFLLGRMHQKGRGVPMDAAEAALWYHAIIISIDGLSYRIHESKKLNRQHRKQAAPTS
jgi:TPR repeat protein